LKRQRAPRRWRLLVGYCVRGGFPEPAFYMCCFSRPVESVNATKIFARAFSSGPEEEWQFIVYAMSIQAREELAMVLPIPVKPNSGEDAVRFISLKSYPTFFARLEAGFFPPPAVSARALGGGTLSTRLTVHDVGEFHASFVPTVSDFSRLDPRFRLPEGTWEKLPQYQNYGFAVFKLQPGARTVHPMAFSFPRRDAKTVFFPTVHIHDGKIHSRAHFDHTLYCQRGPEEKFPITQWRESLQLAKTFMDIEKARAIIEPDQHCYRMELRGMLKNADTVLS
jgi:hypothetical protein